jgi:membrane-associated protein
MSITDQLLAALSLYGLPVLFAILVIGCAGIPLPSSLMLVAAGSFVQLGDMKLWQVMAVASAGSIIGDQIGYSLGRWGGPRAERLSRRIGGEAKIKSAKAFTKRWGGAAIFFSRWLVTPLGPWLNLTSGMAGYSWARFLWWDILGEVLWVFLYLMLGKFFSDRVQALVEIFGSLAWVIVGLIIAVMLGWQLLRYIRPPTPIRTQRGEMIVDTSP